MWLLKSIVTSGSKAQTIGEWKGRNMDCKGYNKKKKLWNPDNKQRGMKATDINETEHDTD